MSDKENDNDQRRGQQNEDAHCIVPIPKLALEWFERILRIHGASEERHCELLCLMRELKEQLCAAKDEIMASITTFGDLLAAMNEVTNTLATNITALLARIDAGGLTAAQEAEVEAALQAQLEALRAVAASSSAPVPTVPTPPTV